MEGAPRAVVVTCSLHVYSDRGVVAQVPPTARRRGQTSSPASLAVWHAASSRKAGGATYSTAGAGRLHELGGGGLILTISNYSSSPRQIGGQQFEEWPQAQRSVRAWQRRQRCTLHCTCIAPRLGMVERGYSDQAPARMTILLSPAPCAACASLGQRRQCCTPCTAGGAAGTECCF